MEHITSAVIMLFYIIILILGVFFSFGIGTKTRKSEKKPAIFYAFVIVAIQALVSFFFDIPQFISDRFGGWYILLALTIPFTLNIGLVLLGWAEDKKGYIRLAIKTLILITAIEVVAIFIAAFCEPTTSVTLQYFTVFINVMILGGVFFRERALWEIKMGLFPAYKNDKPLTTYLLAMAYLLALLFFVVYYFSFKGLWEIIISDDYKHLFHTPTLISGIALLLLTAGGQILRHLEAED